MTEVLEDEPKPRVRKRWVTGKNLLIFMVVIAILAAIGIGVYQMFFAAEVNARFLLEQQQIERRELVRVFSEQCEPEPTVVEGVATRSCVLFVRTGDNSVVLITAIVQGDGNDGTGNVVIRGMHTPRDPTQVPIPQVAFSRAAVYRQQTELLAGPRSIGFATLAAAWVAQMPPPVEPTDSAIVNRP